MTPSYMSNKELEYSFICTNWDITNKQIIDWAWYKPKDSKNYTIADFYYDTKDRLLQQNKYVFRRRIGPKGNMKYAIKGPTIIGKGGDWVPERLEIESKNYRKIFSKLNGIFPKLDTQDLDEIQARSTYRTEVNFPEQGYDLFIDKTMYEQGTEYFNIEIECTDKSKIQYMKDFAWELKGKIGIYEAIYSKFQMGEAVKALNMGTERIGNVNYRKVLEWFKQQRKQVEIL